MGILNKILFWRREPELDFDDLAKDSLPKDPLIPPEEEIDTQQRRNLGLDESSPFPDDSPSPVQPPSSTSYKPSPYQQSSSYSRPPPPTSFSSPDRELELINSKLDTIKALLASLDQRLATVER